MRNLTAEKKFTDRLLITGGLLVLAGLVGLLIGSQMWILENCTGPVFWLLEGLWAILAGVMFSTVARIAAYDRQSAKPLDSSNLK